MGQGSYKKMLSKKNGRSISKEEAIAVVKELTESKSSCYVLVEYSKFKTSFQGSGFKSSQYKGYYILCHANTKYHVGWVVCRVVLNGYCPVGRGLIELNTRK